MTLTATQSDIYKGIVGNGTTSLKSGRFLQVVKRKGSPDGHSLHGGNYTNVTGAERGNGFCLKNISRWFDAELPRVTGVPSISHPQGQAEDREDLFTL